MRCKVPILLALFVLFHRNEKYLTMKQGSDDRDPLEIPSDKTIVNLEDYDTAELPTADKDVIWEWENTCGPCVWAAVILCAVNAMTFGLFVKLGDMLGDLMLLRTMTAKDTGNYIDRQQFEVITSMLAMAAVLVLNLGTFYFLATRSDRSRRSLKAGGAVFGCHRRGKEYTEATLPLSSVLELIWRESRPCEIRGAQLLCGVITVLAALAALTACIVALTDSSAPLCVIFLMVPLALWAFVCRLASQGNFLVPEASECELAEYEGGGQSQEPDGLV
jgi:hypothetical protein